MLTPAHIAASYLLSQAPRLVQMPLSSSEVIAVTMIGNILDLDFVLGTFLGKKGDDHHNFITHTPIFVLIAWTASFIFFSHYFSQPAWVMILISLLLHLVLDDISYWFCKLGWQKMSKYPQINWFYPFTKFVMREYEKTNNDLLNEYLVQAKVNVIFEVLLITFAIGLWLYEK
jgi:membrane-bound metal-dependent hydrolase YbcI (DUF457 family)